MFCRKCNTELKKLPTAFDAFAFFDVAEPRYCTNDKCVWFGVVVVAGIIETKNNETAEGK
jgi:hypothetical protein